ncbi:related to FET5 - multicopper oxidase [Pseudozyma flocculosa]|nr:related to FET5 - multicopper oxidase [Pseudozyma flocculosa]
MRSTISVLSVVLLLGLALCGTSHARPATAPQSKPLVAQLQVKASGAHLKQLEQNDPDSAPNPVASLEEGLGKVLNASYVSVVQGPGGEGRFAGGPKTHHFDWNIHYADGAPDGYAKRQIMINGQAPGPTIECNEGDEIVVMVHNHLDVGTGIHWHGMFQNSTPYMDGIPGFTQCPIPAGGSFEYRFRVQGQFGTYWYHSHEAVQYTDGLYGPLIVHSPNDPYQQGRDYDDEIIILLADNYHDYADKIVREMLSPAGYKGTPAAPSPQSALINGRGVFNCSMAEHKSRCADLKTPTRSVVPGKTYRLRIINGGSHAFNYVSIDGHMLDVIAADGTPIFKQSVHRIPLHNGQRYDALVTMDVGEPGDSFLLRSFIETSCFAVVDPALDPTANLTLQYQFFPEEPVSSPVPRDWSDMNNSNNTGCVDFSDDLLTPLIPQTVPENKNPDGVGKFITGFGFMNISSTQRVGRFFVNGTSYVNYINRPFLESVHRGGAINPAQITSMTFNDDVWVADIILVNTDVIDHPYHLHGVESHIIGRGSGNLTVEEWKTKSFNTINPPRRDTIVVPQKTWAVLRVFSDNPGVWAMHCHIAFHLAGGFMGAVVIHPEAIKQLPYPSSVLDLCPTDAASLNTIEVP